MKIAKWDLFEAAFEGPSDGNPFVDVQLAATFSSGDNRAEAEGFYDGDGLYKVRFMPDTEGLWRYDVRSNCPALDGRSGEFECTAAREGVHGPVIVALGKSELRPGFPIMHGTRFSYADGADYQPVGTTCYAWAHQGDSLEEQTLKTLADAPFNKMRMCVFPKHYDFNHNEPEYYAYEGSLEDGFDFTRFNPAFFRHFEKRVSQLMELGIEADLILFHPYDRWGFSKMDHEADMRYLHYIVARLSAFRNVWWSFANEYDLMPTKTMADWDDFFKTVAVLDPASHLRSIHNCFSFYDHGKRWVTHASVQHSDLALVSKWMDDYKKPVVVDECCYEGNISHDWGNITAQEMVNRMWIGFALGAYVGHGETYLPDDGLLWWSHGGVLKGESPKRIAFLREIFEDMPGVPERSKFFYGFRDGIHVGEEYFLQYYNIRQPIEKKLALPTDKKYRVDVIDAWNCTVTTLPGTYSGAFTAKMPGLPYQAVRAVRVE